MAGEQYRAGHNICLRCLDSPTASASGQQLTTSSWGRVHIVDDDKAVRDSLGSLLRSMGYQVTLHGSASEFLNIELPYTPTCLIVDVRLPGMSGLELQAHLTRLNIALPIILMSGFGDIPIAVKGMKAGAFDFFTKPIRDQDLLDAVAAAIQLDQSRRQKTAQTDDLRDRCVLLTSRERQVIALVASGLMNKQIANELSISEVTVKMHRSNAMRKLRTRSVVWLARAAEILNTLK